MIQDKTRATGKPIRTRIKIIDTSHSGNP